MALNEHHKLNKKGELEGLYTLDVHGEKGGSFTDKDLWGRVDQIIYEYFKLHPVEMGEVIQENKLIAENKLTVASGLNPYGITNKDRMGLNLHIRMPAGLLRTLEMFAPELFEDRKLYHKFVQRYQALNAF